MEQFKNLRAFEVKEGRDGNWMINVGRLEDDLLLE